mmetsp:Transcript_27206/g.26253  ORF Transcript_27206/g.26253 Transcript_27206/m.26253 type:complete len:118 (-) Transcript_27206:80-433(-)
MPIVLVLDHLVLSLLVLALQFQQTIPILCLHVEDGDVLGPGSVTHVHPLFSLLPPLVLLELLEPSVQTLRVLLHLLLPIAHLCLSNLLQLILLARSLLSFLFLREQNFAVLTLPPGI